MGQIGTRIRERMGLVAYSKFRDYVDSVNKVGTEEELFPGDPGYLSISEGDAGWPSLESVDLDYTNAIGDSVEEYFSDGPGSYRPLDTPVWKTTDASTQSIIETDEVGVFQPQVTLTWEPLSLPSAWSSATTYSLDDLVTYNSVDYIAIQDSTNNDAGEANLNKLPDEEDSVWWSEIQEVEIETRVFRKKGTGSYQQIGVVADPGVTFVDENVAFNTVYTYKLIRFDSAFRFSSFSGDETITIDNQPVPEKPSSPPEVVPGRGVNSLSLGAVISGSATIVKYEIESRSSLADSSNDGSYSIPSYPTWTSWEFITNSNATELIYDNGVKLSRVYQYRYRAVSNYGVEGPYSDPSDLVIPFADVDFDELYLSYFNEVFHSIVPTGNNFAQIVHSHSSSDPNRDTNLNPALTVDSYWWRGDTGEIWKRNGSNTAWITTPYSPTLNLLTVSEYDAYILSTVDVATKTILLDNFKVLIFRKLSLERYSSKIKNIENDVGYLSFRDKFINLVDTYFNDFYGLLVDTSSDSTNHHVDYVKEKYTEYLQSERELAAYILEEFFSTKSRILLNDDYK